MHKNFVEGGGKCGYHTHRKQLVAKNISFAKLGKEECEHSTNETEICDICATQQIHILLDLKPQEKAVPVRFFPYSFILFSRSPESGYAA